MGTQHCDCTLSTEEQYQLGVLSTQDLFREKKGLQPGACRHGKPRARSGLRAKLEGHL